MMSQGFLKTLSRSEFQALLQTFPCTGTELVHFHRARNRVLAEDLISPEDLPTGPRSSMDGYALRAVDSFGAGESSPAYLDCIRTLEVNEFPDFTLAPGQCAWIPTGGFLPAGADSVVMVEYTQEIGAGTIEVRQSVAPGENVMERGEDAAAGQPILIAGSVLRTQEVGLLAALGLDEVKVYRRPRAAILSTGDELVPVEATPAPGRIRDVNSHTVACLVEEAGGDTLPGGIVGDDLARLVRALRGALEQSDVVFLSGGSSKGTRDLTIAALEQIPGTEILAHGVRISPGKPTILARAAGKAVVGLPGQVGSAQVVMTVLGQPFLRHLAGDREAFAERLRPLRRARLARNLESRQGREDFVRVRLEPAEGGLPLARPVLGKSGLLRTLLQSDGLLVVPADVEGFREGQEVDVWIL
jgi:molybdopterin molybdotransferase